MPVVLSVALLYLQASCLKATPRVSLSLPVLTESPVSEKMTRVGAREPRCVVFTTHLGVVLIGLAHIFVSSPPNVPAVSIYLTNSTEKSGPKGRVRALTADNKTDRLTACSLCGLHFATSHILRC